MGHYAVWSAQAMDQNPGWNSSSTLALRSQASSRAGALPINQRSGVVTTAYGADPVPGAPEKSLGGRAGLGLSLQPQALGSPLSWPVRHKVASREVTSCVPWRAYWQERVGDKGRFQTIKFLSFSIFLRVFPNFPKDHLAPWACFNGGELLFGPTCQELSTLHHPRPSHTPQSACLD